MQDIRKMQNALSNTQYSALINSCSCRLLTSCFAILLIFLYGCNSLGPPTDYYQKTLEMEGYGKQVRQETGRNPGDTVNSTENQETAKVIKKTPDEPPIVEVLANKTIQEKHENVVVTQQPTQKSLNQEPSIIQPSSTAKNPDTVMNLDAISVSSDIIKSALEIAGINVRAVELVNGRTEGGKNSVRVNFICESSKVVNERFFTVCAVTYHLNKASKSIDVVVGIAEDSQANLLGVLQSNTEDIMAWMDNKITRAEWYSRITRKML
jgi:hypothetical protein